MAKTLTGDDVLRCFAEAWRRQNPDRPGCPFDHTPQSDAYRAYRAMAAATAVLLTDLVRSILETPLAEAGFTELENASVQLAKLASQKSQGS